MNLSRARILAGGRALRIRIKGVDNIGIFLKKNCKIKL